MLDREIWILEAHKMTFEWIYRDPCANDKPWTSFIDWSEKQEKGLYWITGKAGSGKSTLMKYLYKDARTIALLENWASPSKLITAAFFFWNSGSNMQMSRMGLLRSLLFQVLKSVPSSVALAFPERWEVYALFGENNYPWSWQELFNALKLLVLGMRQDTKFCFFIDGLDEFDGNPSDLTDLLLDLVALAPNLKICTASRPWANFEDAFKGRPNLLLQDLTYPDIQVYVDTKFHANAGFAELEEREPKYARELLTRVALKAEGVFLWVHLVVRSLLTGLTNGDRVSDLQRRLDQLPPRLGDLFQKILDNLDPFYLDHASQLFQLARASRVPPTLLCLSLADEEDPESCFQTAVKPFTNSEILSRSRNMKRRLNSRCKGLLEVAPVLKSPRTCFRTTPDQSEKAGNEGVHSDEPDSQLCENMANQKVQYLHRTVKDFLEAPAVWSWIVGSNSKPFDPHLSLCRSFLLQLKGLSMTSLQIDAFWNIIIWCIEHAATAKLENRNMSTRLLDELDQSIGKLTTQQYHNFQAILETFGGHVDESRLHWTISLLNWKTGTSFLYLATMCDLNWYLETKLTPEYFEELPDEKPRLLRAALSDYTFLMRYRDMPFCSRKGPRTETARMLLLNMKLVGGHGKDWAKVKNLLERHGLGGFPTGSIAVYAESCTPSVVSEPSSSIAVYAESCTPSGVSEPSSPIVVHTESCTPSGVSEPSGARVGSSGEAKHSREPKRAVSLQNSIIMLYRRFLDRINRNKHPKHLQTIKEEGKKVKAKQVEKVRQVEEGKEELKTSTSTFSRLAEMDGRCNEALWEIPR